jgi:dolichol-phosphate mannosyltransferase
MKKKISIVIPVYNEAPNVLRLHDRLEHVVESLPSYDWRYVFVDDGSEDESLEVLTTLAVRNRRVLILSFSKNFGKEIALTAGAHESVDSDALICIDADLQHPPELIPTLVGKWESKFDVVIAVRLASENEPILRKMCSSFYYWLMGRISRIEMKPRATDFRLYDRKVVKAFTKITERERIFRGLMDWLGFRRTYVEFNASARVGGRPAYSLIKLTRLAVNSFTSFSLLPLRLAGYLGIIICTSCCGIYIWAILNYFILGAWIITPLAMVSLTNTFLMGITLIALGLVALYIGIIHTEVLNRPLYVIREKVGGDK